LGIGFGHRQNGGRLALGVVDGGLFFTLGTGNEGFTFAGGNIDLLLATALGRGNQRAFFRARR
jgi:hypothetical protein